MKEWLRENPKGVLKAIPYDSSRSGDIEIPEGAEICYFFSGDYLRSGEDNFTFYKNGITEVYNGEEDGWINTDSSCFDFILNKGKLVWKREQQKVDKGKSTKKPPHDNVENNSVVSHPQHYVSDPCIVNGKTISDGGSSSYYFTKLPKHIIDEINYTGGIEIKDIARYVYDNNADAFNIIKAQKRIIEDLKGLGKVGADAKYDAKKILFFAEEQYKQIIEGVKIND